MFSLEVKWYPLKSTPGWDNPIDNLIEHHADLDEALFSESEFIKQNDPRYIIQTEIFHADEGLGKHL